MKELIYPSTYHAMKAGPCRVGVCKNDGKCGKCKEYGLLRMYAARDTDRINELRALVGELADALDTTIHYRDFICDCGEPSLHNCSVRSRVCFAKNRLLVMKARDVVKAEGGER